MRKFFRKISKHILLIASIAVPLALVVFWISITEPYHREDFENAIGFTFCQCILIIGAIITLLWTNKRYVLAEKRHRKAEDSVILNKVNTIYLEAVKVLSRTDKNKVLSANLINSIQASIDSHHEGREEEVQKVKRKMLNFSRMNLAETDLEGANLTGVTCLGAKRIPADIIQRFNLKI